MKFCYYSVRHDQTNCHPTNTGGRVCAGQGERTKSAAAAIETEGTIHIPVFHVYYLEVILTAGD